MENGRLFKKFLGYLTYAAAIALVLGLLDGIALSIASSGKAFGVGLFKGLSSGLFWGAIASVVLAVLDQYFVAKGYDQVLTSRAQQDQQYATQYQQAGAAGQFGYQQQQQQAPAGGDKGDGSTPPAG